MKNRLFTALLLLIGMVLLGNSALGQEFSGTPDEICEAATPAEDPASRSYATPPENILEEGIDYRAIFCTEAGAVYIDLLENYAPITVNNFVALAQDGYYNNTVFHRVMEDFMAQGGDPTATGRGGPGYQFQDEFVGFLTFSTPGWLAMANSGENTNGSQFFITTVPTPHLDYRHTIFGKVLEGQENVLNLVIGNPVPEADASALHTVVIITNPDDVVTTYEGTESLSREAVAGTLSDLAAQLPETIAVNNEISGDFDTDETVNQASEDMQDAFAEFLSANNHEYRVRQELLNAECSQQIFFSSTGYTLDSFASADDASNALDDGLLEELVIAEGYTLDDSGTIPVYVRPTEVCDGSEGTEAVAFLQRGKYVVTAYVTYSSQIPVTADVLILEGVARGVYDAILAEVFQAELP